MPALPVHSPSPQRPETAPSTLPAANTHGLSACTRVPSVRLLPPCVVDLQCAYAFQACCKSTSEGQGAGVLSPLMAARPEQPLLMPFVCQEASRPRRSWVPILILFVFYVLKRMCPFGIRTYCLRSFQYWRPRGRRYVDRWRAGRCRATPPFASEYGVSVLVRRQKKGRWWSRVAPFTVPSLSPSPLPCWLVLRSCVAF